MTRFDVYANTGASAQTTPYMVDVQSHLLEGLETRVVIPLRLRSAFPKVALSEQLTPVFNVLGSPCILETPKLAAVPKRILSVPVASLAQDQHRIIAAMDFLFQGY